MSDVSKTSELIRALNVAREHFLAIAGSGEIQVWEDTGEKRGIDHQAKVWADRGARLASEALAATRVPVQGEPNDDREAKAEALAEWQAGSEMRQYSEFFTSWEDGYDEGFSRATVPDATTHDREALARQLREDDDPANTWWQATEEQREYWRKEADILIAGMPKHAQVDAAWPRANTYFDPPLSDQQMAQVQQCINDALTDARAGASVDRDALVTKALERIREVADSGLAGPYVRDLPKDFDSNWGRLQSMWPVVVAVDVALYSRATVPDAATERVDRLNREFAEMDAIDLKAERDAALTAVERVRAIHYETEGVHCHTVCAHRYCKDDSEDQHRWPCPTVAALDGAPEPEWEYEVRNEVHDFKSDYTPDLEQAKRWAQEDVYDFIVRRRKAGPWEACNE